MTEILMVKQVLLSPLFPLHFFSCDYEQQPPPSGFFPLLHKLVSVFSNLVAVDRLTKSLVTELDTHSMIIFVASYWPHGRVEP